MHVAACFRLMSLLDFEEQEEQEEEQEDVKRVPDGHGRSFGSRPWQKYQLSAELLLDLCLNVDLKKTSLKANTVGGTL